MQLYRAALLRHTAATVRTVQSRLLSSTAISLDSVKPPKPPSLKPAKPRPAPVPLGDPEQQREFEELVKRAEEVEFAKPVTTAPASSESTTENKHRDAENNPLEAFEGDVNPRTKEVGGPKGPEPTRYSDWERKGRVVDF